MPKATRKNRDNFFRRRKFSENSSETSDDEDNNPLKMEEISNQLAQMMAAITSLQAKQSQLEQLTTAPAGGNPVAVNSGEVPIGDFFRIPDPIKSLQSFEGNRKQLSSWLNTAENTLNLFKDKIPPQLYAMYVTAVTNKISGKAKDILCLAGNPQDFDNIKEILINALGDRQELSTYKCQLWQNKMLDSMTIHKYYHRTKEIVQNIKTLAKQNAKYRDNWEAISTFIDEDALAAFISGLRGNYFGHAQAARPKDIEDAYAFLCKFKSQEINASNMDEISKTRFTNNKTQINSNNKSYDPKSQKQQMKPKSNLPIKPEFDRKDSVEPMEIDPSLRSRLSYNKKHINNNEISSELEDPTSNESSDDENEVNFCQVDQTQIET